MKVMVVPSASKSNRYLSSLIAGLEEYEVEVVDYEWCSLLPILWPLLHERPDIIHIHWLNNLNIGPTLPRTVLKGIRMPVELLIARFLGIKVVWTVHNLTPHGREYPRWDLLCRIIVSRWCCDHLIVHCQAAEKAVRRRYHLSMVTPITVIPHGHYLGSYPNDSTQEEARQTLGIPQEDLVFTYFGRIRPYKQVPKLIETFSNLDIDNSQLLIAGRPKSDSLKQEIERRCAGRDDITARLEFIPGDEIGDYLNAGDVIVLPYRDILTSGSAVLAMSFGRPVIAPRIGCLPELITHGDTGLLYNPDKQGDFGRKMKEAAGADLEVMGSNSYERIARRTWNSVAERTRRVYRA